MKIDFHKMYNSYSSSKYVKTMDFNFVVVPTIQITRKTTIFAKKLVYDGLVVNKLPDKSNTIICFRWLIWELMFIFKNTY